MIFGVTLTVVKIVNDLSRKFYASKLFLLVLLGNISCRKIKENCFTL